MRWKYCQFFFSFWQHFFFRWQNICEQVRLRHVYSVFTYSVKFSHILSRFSIISIEIWASSLIRKNSLIVYKFLSWCTIYIYKYIYYSQQLEFLLTFRWQTICDQVQNYRRCEGHFSSSFSVVGQCKFQNKARETSRTLYGGFWDIPCPTTENGAEKWPWQLW